MKENKQEKFEVSGQLGNEGCAEAKGAKQSSRDCQGEYMVDSRENVINVKLDEEVLEAYIRNISSVCEPVAFTFNREDILNSMSEKLPDYLRLLFMVRVSDVNPEVKLPFAMDRKMTYLLREANMPASFAMLLANIGVFEGKDRVRHIPIVSDVSLDTFVKNGVLDARSITLVSNQLKLFSRVLDLGQMPGNKDGDLDIMSTLSNEGSLYSERILHPQKVSLAALATFDSNWFTALRANVMYGDKIDLIRNILLKTGGSNE